ncbi:PREDICTED: WW domain-binding protein 2 isoform X2 [Eufriesea mexicana]|uniref:WW domain-binding protein 2 isoform X2 n=1 Tax=Eufriesea mexicana TaxID=516756 RepID=UPI00083C798D|nr:PREDICTED: WW domain-binding protein 2 isoform X2 [Eufriesea mexicana]
MSLNTAHANGGVLIHAGERMLLYCDNVTVEFHGQEQAEFIGTKRGSLCLTTHRMIFNAKDQKEKMQSFSFPFVTLREVEIEQPMFGANYIKGKCRAQPNGNWIGECKFKLNFKSGGAIEFGGAMVRAAAMAQRNGPANDDPPPYQPPTSNWYAAPPPAYQAAPTGYYGWLPRNDAFSDAPPANTVYMTDMPPPYPGINTPYQGYANAPSEGAWGSSSQQSGWTPPQQNGAPGWANPSYNAQPMSQADAKAAEAAQSAYYDPNRPQCAYVPPPAYYESPPSFQQATEKKDQ